ncbi:MAG: tetratricopeptide repeat protein [Bacteroidota bacterium]
MKTTPLFFFLLLLSGLSIQAQTNEELARQKAVEAIKLMDNGQLEESIVLLQESKKLDSTNYIYAYEIALANVYLKNYQTAIDELESILTDENISSQVYQLLGNCYSMKGDKDKALTSYEQGLEKFPEAGNLHLEKGNVYTQTEKYNLAIKSYEQGVLNAPSFPSNYYQLAKIFLRSSNKVPGLIYGEIFMNLERTTARTQEMSSLLYEAYKGAIQLMGDSMSLDFCEPVIAITDESLEKEEIQLPYCMIFGKSMLIAITVASPDSISLSSLAQIRRNFIDIYVQNDMEEHPNVLLQYHQDMVDKGVFDAYNHYLFQIPNQADFNAWLQDNREAYDKFVEWYLAPENLIDINKENRYISFGR